MILLWDQRTERTGIYDRPSGHLYFEQLLKADFAVEFISRISVDDLYPSQSKIGSTFEIFGRVIKDRIGQPNREVSVIISYQNGIWSFVQGEDLE